jgi:hypothetical protein
MKRISLFEHKEVVATYEKNMGKPTEYWKLLEPSKLDRNNDGKWIDLVCSQCKKQGHNKECYHWNLENLNNPLNQKKEALVNEMVAQTIKGIKIQVGKGSNWTNRNKIVYQCYICTSPNHRIDDYPHRQATMEMFKRKVQL